MAPCIQYASFLIRLWRSVDRTEDKDLDWHSEVEHIQSGKSWLFCTLSDLEAFLRQQAIDPQRLDWMEFKENE